jgi:hypothetical protein
MRWLVLPLLALLAAHGIWTLVLKWEFERRLEDLRTSGAPFTGERLQYEPGVRLEAAVPITVEALRADDEIVWRLPPPW